MAAQGCCSRRWHGAAALSMQARMIGTAPLAYLVFSASHLAIHLRYLDRLSSGGDALLRSALALAVALPVVLLAVLARVSRRDGRRRRQHGEQGVEDVLGRRLSRRPAPPVPRYPPFSG